MKTLADELLALLPAMISDFPHGVTARDAAGRLGASEPHVRNAFARLDEEGRAVLVRRRGGRTLYLLPLDYPIAACKNCHAEFERKWKAVCCSRACAISWSWRQPGVAERRKAGIRAERETPQAKERLAEHNRRRWAKPEEHDKLADQNRREWSDPAKRGKRSASIQAALGTLEKRKLYSDLRKRDWTNPVQREKLEAGIRRSKSSPEARALFSKKLKERWRDPVLREKYLAAVRRTNQARFPDDYLTPIQQAVFAVIQAHAQDGVARISSPAIASAAKVNTRTAYGAVAALIRKGRLQLLPKSRPTETAAYRISAASALTS